MKYLSAMVLFAVLLVTVVPAARADCQPPVQVINAGGGVQVWQFCCENGLCTWTRLI